MRSFLMIVLLVYGSLTAKAQFMTEFIADGEDVILNAVQMTGTDIMTAGNSGNKVLFARFNLSGALIDYKTFSVVDETLLPYISSMILDSDGNIVACGHRSTGNEHETTAFILKYDYNTGTVLWLKLFENSGSNFIKVIEKKAGGPYIVTGHSYNSPNAEEAILYSVNRNTGSFTLLNNYNENGSSETYYSIIRAEGSYFTANRVNFSGGGFGRMRGCMSKFTMAGAEVFTKAYLRNTTTDIARLYSVDLAYLNNAIYMTVHGDELSTGQNKDLFLVKSKTDGELNWAKKYDFTNYDSDGSMRSIRVKGQNLYVFGNLYNLGTGYMFLMKLDTTGAVIWANSYSSLGNKSTAPDAMLVYGSNIIMTGYVHDDATPYTNGTLVLVKSANGTLPDGCSTAEPVTVSSKTATAFPNTMATVSHSYTISNPEHANGEISWTTEQTCSNAMRYENTLNGFSIQPNPASGKTVLHLDGAHYTIQIYNSSGQFLSEFQTEEINVEMHTEKFAPGVYYVKQINTNTGEFTSIPFVKN